MFKLVSVADVSTSAALPPGEVWPVVEEKPGYGVDKRCVRYMLIDPLARQAPKVFYPPEWWTVHSVQEAAQSVDDRGELTGEWVYRDATPRKDGGALIRLGWATVIEVAIDGVEVGIPEASVLDRLFEALQEHHMIRISIDRGTDGQAG